MPNHYFLTIRGLAPTRRYVRYLSLARPLPTSHYSLLPTPEFAWALLAKRGGVMPCPWKVFISYFFFRSNSNIHFQIEIFSSQMPLSISDIQSTASTLVIPVVFYRYFSSLARYLGDIFAHAYFHHREAFERFKKFSRNYTSSTGPDVTMFSTTF